MGLFELSSWGGEKVKEKYKKKRSQKKKEKDGKQNSNSISPKKSKFKKKKKETLLVDNASLNESQEKKSPKKKRNARKKKLQKLQKMSENSSKPENLKEKLVSKVFSNVVSKKKNSQSQTTATKLEVQNLESKQVSKVNKLNVQKQRIKQLFRNNLPNSLKNDKKAKKRHSKVVNTVPELLKTNSEASLIVSKSKKRKRGSEQEESEQGITRKKQKKLKGKSNFSQKSTESNAPLSIVTPGCKININKLRTLLQDKRQEKKKQKVLSLRERMLGQLRSSRFRFLNETLYNNESSQSKKYFKDDPEAFAAYHEGYKQQVAHWPVNPLDIIIASIKKMPKEHVVADFGCGEAKLAESVAQKVHSFDFVAVNEKVKACDMAHTPLLTNGVNVVVFCLSLMGTNLADYLLEANRVLKKGGIMKIAEVESRLDSVENFVSEIAAYGFVNTWTDLSHDLFYFLDFRKDRDVEKEKKKKLPAIELKPCLYKKR